MPIAKKQIKIDEAFKAKKPGPFPVFSEPEDQSDDDLFDLPIKELITSAEQIKKPERSRHFTELQSIEQADEFMDLDEDFSLPPVWKPPPINIFRANSSNSLKEFKTQVRPIKPVPAKPTFMKQSAQDITSPRMEPMEIKFNDESSSTSQIYHRENRSENKGSFVPDIRNELELKPDSTTRTQEPTTRKPLADLSNKPETSVLKKPVQPIFEKKPPVVIAKPTETKSFAAAKTEFLSWLQKIS